MEPRPELPPKGRGGVLERVGRWVVRHPWHPVIFWVVLLVVAVPFLPLLGSVTTNSETSLPTNSPSAQASAELARLFPQSDGGSSSTLLFYGPNLTDANAQRVIQNVTAAIGSDSSIVDVASIATVYTTYSGYLAGQAELAEGVILGSLRSSPSLPVAINETAELLWGTPGLFVQTWTGLLPNCTAEPSACNYPAYEQTAAALGGGAGPLAVLNAFYNGYEDSGAGFNSSSSGCASDVPSDVVACATAAARTNELPLIPVLFNETSEQAMPRAVLGRLGIENATLWPNVQAVATDLLAPTAGLPAGFLTLVWDAFPSGFPGPSSASDWANATSAGATLATEPLPVPFAIYSQYVAAAGTATIVQVTYTVSDDYTDASGTQPVYSDVGKIDALVPSVLRASDPTRSITYVQTGPAPLDLLSQTSVNETLSLVLPLTVGLLLAIAMLYFRSPITPLLTFAGLGIALVLGLGGTVLVGTLVGHVDTTSLTLEEVFVLGVGTDYSIFIASRYREELVHGKSNDEAIITAVTWAGKSVATSGSAAIIATLALTFSGIALLSQWGSVLSLAVFITLLLSLTLIPAFLKLLGPRIFWPTSGARFERHAATVADRLRREQTYFYRAGRATQRHPWAFVGGLLAVSVPLVVVAITAPLAYDFYQQLPAGQPATNGLTELDHYFGPGFAEPSFALVTFSSPLVVANVTNASEFTDVAALTARADATGGIAAVQSPVGPYGAPLGEWLNLSTLAVGPRANLLGTLSAFVGSDGRTVLFDLVPSAAGLSLAAVNAVNAVDSSFHGYAADHPEVVSTAFGGGAPVIRDLADQTSMATEFMILAVTIGLILVLLVVLRSWIIALLGVGTIGLSISWAWATTYLVFQGVLGFPIFFYVRTILFILVLGLGIDYTIFLLTRISEERERGRTSSDAAVEGVARTGGIITAAAIILASAFGALLVGSFTLIRAIGFSVAVAVILDAMVVRTYLVPAFLQTLGDRAWTWFGRRPKPTDAPAAGGALATGVPSPPPAEGAVAR